MKLARMWRRRSDDDFGAEVEAHLELEVDRLVAEGMTVDAARAAARKAFGSVARARESFHERSRWTWLEQLLQDLRYAWRTFLASPAFLATTVLTLAVGLSLLTVAFSIFNAYVLRPFAVADPHRLFRIAWRAPSAVGTSFSWRDYDELRGRTDLFDAVVGKNLEFVSSEGRKLVVSTVSGNYFSVLRPRMRAGRPLTDADVGQPVAVVSEDALPRLFGGDGDVLGRSVKLDTKALTIVGVVRREFVGLDDLPCDVWQPVADRAHGTEVVARLRQDVSPVEASLRLQDLAVRMAPAGTAPRDVRAVLVASGSPNELSVELIALLSPVIAAFALVLLTACFNVSNVMLARALSRHREMAVRLSLGASRGRIVRQLLTEGGLIALLAGGCALALAAWLVRIGVLIMFRTLPPFVSSLLRVIPMPLDARVFFFALAAAAVTALGFALAPALQASRQPLTDALRGQRSGQAAASRMRNVLVVAQVAVSIVLVVSALVLARNFTALARLDLGYATTNIFSLNVRGDLRVMDRVGDALTRDPRIATLAATSGNPLFVTRLAPMAPQDSRAAIPTLYTFVSPEFFPLLQIPVSRGRPFRQDEARAAEHVAIVSEATARAFWPGRDPIGETIRIERVTAPGARVETIDGYSQVTVVGVARDVVSGLMFEGTDPGHVYLPATTNDAHAVALLFQPRAGDFRPDMLRETFRGLGYNPDAFEIISLEEMRQTEMYPMRAASWVGALLGSIALVLSVTGLYGVLSYTLAQRTREIGIRMALGATAGAVVALVMRQSGRMAALGAAIGLAIAYIALKSLASVVELRAISLLNPLPFAVGVLVVAAATALAAYYPSRRATRIDPAETLRAEG